MNRAIQDRLRAIITRPDLERLGSWWQTQETAETRATAWDNHVQRIFAERDAVVTCLGTAGWLAIQVKRRAARTAELRRRRLAGYRGA